MLNLLGNEIGHAHTFCYYLKSVGWLIDFQRHHSYFRSHQNTQKYLDQLVLRQEWLRIIRDISYYAFFIIMRLFLTPSRWVRRICDASLFTRYSWKKFRLSSMFYFAHTLQKSQNRPAADVWRKVSMCDDEEREWQFKSEITVTSFLLFLF